MTVPSRTDPPPSHQEGLSNQRGDATELWKPGTEEEQTSQNHRLGPLLHSSPATNLWNQLEQTTDHSGPQLPWGKQARKQHLRALGSPGNN